MSQLIPANSESSAKRVNTMENLSSTTVSHLGRARFNAVGPSARRDRIFERLKQTCLSLVAEERSSFFDRHRTTHGARCFPPDRPRKNLLRVARVGCERGRNVDECSARWKGKQMFAFSFSYDASNSEEMVLSCEEITVSNHLPDCGP